MLSVRLVTCARLATILCAERDVRVELDDTAATGDLLGFLRSFDCSAQMVGPHLVEVEFERPPRAELALVRLDRIRLDAFIRVWNSLHPTAHATLLDDQAVHSV
jgi:hypothetical protein